MNQLVIFLEELSAKAMLDELLPRILPVNTSHFCIPFEGKQDLDKQIEKRLRGWNTPKTAFMILRDQDSSDCRHLKQALQEKALNAGRENTVIRIACRELESWYFGDLSAVEQALELSNIRRYSNDAKYRTPDSITNPSSELEKITHGTYQKVSSSRAIGKLIDPSRNSSLSFKFFIEGITKALENLESQNN